MALFTRQPFAEIGTPRLQALSSSKNRQNAIPIFSEFTSPPKPPTQNSARKRRAPDVYEDNDENTDPSIFNSPSKKSKTAEGPLKPSQFSIVFPSKPTTTFLGTPPSIPSVRKALSSPKPATTDSTPISLSRGSPKHKRVGLLSKRRASSSPYRRVDPPTSLGSPGLPFSIDAALKGSIPDYTPKPQTPAPSHASTLEDSMPKSWFFDIHEDTPEQEAANLMEHSASILDISSDDDSDTKWRNGELERGKENIPPPDYVPLLTASRAPASDALDTEEHVAQPKHVKLPRLRNIAQDAMDEDRRPLGDLPASEFYGEGLDANSYVTVDAGIDRPSSLSRECDLGTDASEEKTAEATLIEDERNAVEAETNKAQPIINHVDVDVSSACTSPSSGPSQAENPAPLEVVAPLSEPTSEEHTVSASA
ncbi:hypothetical protein M011DRAFT_461546 [Sporormia fimetaria CBS 119925]|uniref:Uncharacterized protein n=1 Tax=Sporormia fimetaria CBS 119925 TaxID=1340428 RepID=A0A6A6UZ04_9PLEO|nr:hypothetical protein M011DRAFT_461546 [Sporormia fimetaria CBS 119925]